jgi:predicted nucleotidyltransferase
VRTRAHNGGVPDSAGRPAVGPQESRDSPGASRSRAPARYNSRWTLAEQIAAAVRQKYAAEVQAIGACGSLAHGDDTDASDIELIVVTRWAGTGPRPSTRRVEGVIVDLGVIGADEYLRHARTLTTSWPLTADRYLTVKTLHDPDHWYARLRDTHLARLAGATPREFGTLGRDGSPNGTRPRPRCCC